MGAGRLAALGAGFKDTKSQSLQVLSALSLNPCHHPLALKRTLDKHHSPIAGTGQSAPSGDEFLYLQLQVIHRLKSPARVPISLSGVEQVATSISFGRLRLAPLLKIDTARYSPGKVGSYPLQWAGSSVGLQNLANFQSLWLKGLWQQMRILSGQLSALKLPDVDNPLYQPVAISSQPDALTASASRDAQVPGRATAVVYWPAEGGEIRGKIFNPIGYTELSGTYDFTLTIDGTDHELSVDIATDGSQTHEEVLELIARAINGVSSEVQAQVVKGYTDAYDPAPRSQPMNRTVQLVVRSTSNGQGADFYLWEEDDGVLSYYGLNSVRPPRAAWVRTGGKIEQLASNELTLDDGLQATLTGPSRGWVDVQVDWSVGGVLRQLAEVLERYNAIISELHTHQLLVKPTLADRLTRPLEQLGSQLEQAGFKVGEDGTVEMSPDVGQRMLEGYANWRELLVGEQGWLTQLGQKLEQILELEPEDFARELSPSSPLASRKQAWSLVESVAKSIISGYY